MISFNHYSVCCGNTRHISSKGFTSPARGFTSLYRSCMFMSLVANDYGRKCRFLNGIARVCCGSLLSCLPQKRHVENLSKKKKKDMFNQKKTGWCIRKPKPKKQTTCLFPKKMLFHKNSKSQWCSTKISPLHTLGFRWTSHFFPNISPTPPGSLTITSQRQLQRSSRVPSSSWTTYFWSRRLDSRGFLP